MERHTWTPPHEKAREKALEYLELASEMRHPLIGPLMDYGQREGRIYWDTSGAAQNHFRSDLSAFLDSDLDHLRIATTSLMHFLLLVDFLHNQGFAPLHLSWEDLTLSAKGEIGLARLPLEKFFPSLNRDTDTRPDMDFLVNLVREIFRNKHPRSGKKLIENCEKKITYTRAYEMARDLMEPREKEGAPISTIHRRVLAVAGLGLAGMLFWFSIPFETPLLELPDTPSRETAFEEQSRRPSTHYSTSRLENALPFLESKNWKLVGHSQESGIYAFLRMQPSPESLVLRKRELMPARNHCLETKSPGLIREAIASADWSTFQVNPTTWRLSRP